MRTDDHSSYLDSDNIQNSISVTEAEIACEMPDNGDCDIDLDDFAVDGAIVANMEVVPCQPIFDCNSEIVAAFKSCANEGGLSKKDMNSILKVINHQSYENKKMTLKSAVDVEKYLAAKLKSHFDDKVIK